MPELPEIELYLSALRTHIVGQEVSGIIIKSAFLLRTWETDPKSLVGTKVVDVSRIGKRIVWHLEKDVHLVFHLMLTGRFHKRKAEALPRGKNDLASFQFDDLSLMLTETASKKRASLHIVNSRDLLEPFRRDSLDVTTCNIQQFENRLRERNQTLKLALINPAIFDGIGNAYSDEILHRARLSPFARTASMDKDSVIRLFDAAKSTLLEWKDRLVAENGTGFPERVTAFRPEMSVHGKFGMPCPVCQRPVQRIVFSEKEWNYCAKCQTGGRRLADRSLSRLLKNEWPDDIDDPWPGSGE